MEWAFIPPFIGSLLPQIINPGLDGDVEGGGGTNPIFGVDGSPVVHDLFIRGYSQAGDLEGSKSWRTILFVPYGRGGAGFSAIDVTTPLPLKFRYRFGRLCIKLFNFISVYYVNQNYFIFFI